ncbi:hypothetical protein CRYUN_Cryun40dG0002200 [Craigia yunnanensis]
MMNISSSSSSSCQASEFEAVESHKLKHQDDVGGGVQVTSFTELVDDVTLHFQIIRLPKRSNMVSVTSILGGASDNTGSGIARRLVLKTGFNVIVACNIPKNSPMLEANAEKKLVEKLIALGYSTPKSPAPGPALSSS